MRWLTYFDEGQLCLIIVDVKPAHCSKWQALGGKL
jgi:hypothetical protein